MNDVLITVETVDPEYRANTSLGCALPGKISHLAS